MSATQDWHDWVADALALVAAEQRNDGEALLVILRCGDRDQMLVTLVKLLSRLIAEVDPPDARLREWAAQPEQGSDQPADQGSNTHSGNPPVQL
jgi:hypothetical protein